MVDYTGSDLDKDRSGRHAIRQLSQPEQEARWDSPDADRLRYPTSILNHPSIRGRGNGAVRAEAMQRAQQTRGNRAVQRYLQAASSQADASARGQDDVARHIEAASGAGEKLDESAKDKLEEGLGSDLSSVRVHTGGEADELARSMGAVAFTTGHDIFFRDGAYEPHSSEGLKLLAHEATHTVQQSAGPVEGTPAGGGVSVSDPSDRFEQEAEHSAERIASAATHESAALTAQRSAHSNAAGAGSAATVVQRFQAPDSGWWNSLGRTGAGALFNAAEFIPGIGNALSATTALGELGVAGGAKLLGNDAAASDYWHAAEMDGLHALPVVGNGLAAQDAGIDARGFWDTLAGNASGPAQTAGDRFNQATGPKVDDALKSLASGGSSYMSGDPFGGTSDMGDAGWGNGANYSIPGGDVSGPGADFSMGTPGAGTFDDESEF